MADWESRPIEELVSLVSSGGTPRARDALYYADSGTPFLKIDDITKSRGRFVDTAEQSITRRALEESAAKVFPAGTVLVTMYGTIRVTKTLRTPMATNQAIAALVPPFRCDPDYLALALSFRRADLERLAAQTTQPNISGMIIRRFRLPVPPLEEQRRIAEILDTIDESIEATECVIAKLRLVQSGLIDRSFDRSQGTLTELGDVCLAPGEYGCVATAEQRRAGWPRYVRITDLTDSGTLRVGSEMGVSPSVAQKAILRPGDIVFARSGATVGKTYLYDPADGLCAFAGYLIRFRPDPTRALPEFVRWWTHSSSYWRWVKRTMREGAQPNINAREYAKAVFPLPSVEEQGLIVASIVEVDAKIKTERGYGEKLRQLRSGLAADLLSGDTRTVAA